MALDVYVGTLTRYYTEDWENVGQRMAREQGFKYNRITPDGPPPPPPQASEITPAVWAWRQALQRGLSPHAPAAELNWDETPDAPYFTDRPGWETYGALLLWAAYSEQPKRKRPKTLPKKGWAEDPVFQKASERDSGTAYRQILHPELWLPADFSFAFQASDVTMNNVWIGSVIALQRSLEALNAATFNMSSAELEACLHDEVDASDALEADAKFGLAAFLALAREGTKNRLPMVLSF